MARLQIKNDKNECRKIRKGFADFFSREFSIESRWIQNHIAHCPKCQSRLAAISRVNLAMTFIKSQTHSLDLLKRANTQAINVLRHNLREVPKAQKLKQAYPEPELTQKLVWSFKPSFNIAACFLILILIKCGVFSSMDKFQSTGKKAYKQYYTNQLGEEIADDLFPGDFT